MMTGTARSTPKSVSSLTPRACVEGGSRREGASIYVAIARGGHRTRRVLWVVRCSGAGAFGAAGLVLSTSAWRTFPVPSPPGWSPASGPKSSPPLTPAGRGGREER
eukprot:5120409-Prymnesium_polylepis.1